MIDLPAAATPPTDLADDGSGLTVPPDSGEERASGVAPIWAVGIARALGAYLAAAAADPAQTRTMVLGSLSLGRPGLDFLDRRAQALKQLLGPGLRAHPDLPTATADMLAGAILEILHDHALRGELGRLPSCGSSSPTLCSPPCSPRTKGARTPSTCSRRRTQAPRSPPSAPALVAEEGNDVRKGTRRSAANDALN